VTCVGNGWGEKKKNDKIWGGQFIRIMGIGVRVKVGSVLSVTRTDPAKDGSTAQIVKWSLKILAQNWGDLI